MLKINSFNFGYRFSVYVRVVAVRCGTLLQPMLVKDLSTSSSIGRSLVLVSCYRSCIIILLNCHRDLQFTVYKFRSNKNKYGMFMSTNNKHVSGIGKGKWRMLEGGGRIFQVWIKIQLNYNLTNVSLPINLQAPRT
jgi:hypothetical protein